MSKNNEFVRQYTKSTIQIQNKNYVEINDDARGTIIITGDGDNDVAK